MKVYVVWDRLYEKVVSAHLKEESALARMNKENQKRVDERKSEMPEGEEDYCYDFEYDEFELEDDTGT